jgi:solute carrier family 9 (sodium/hydrogen exchanger), member 6/7
MSIFAGMVVGLFLRLTAAPSVLDAVSFDYQFFFNLLLPPIILASGYELHQVRSFVTAQKKKENRLILVKN